MKLTLNRREETKGLVFKKPVYCLDVALEFTDEEKQLIKKHKWERELMVGADSKVEEILKAWSSTSALTKGGQFSFKFEFVENLAYFENQLIENAKKLKGNLATVVGFTSGGPSEIEL